MDSIVEFCWVKAGSFNRLVPEPFDGDTQKSTCNVNTHNPESDESKHDVHCNCHVSDCKESPVQCQNGVFNEGDAAGVDKGIGKAELS